MEAESILSLTGKGFPVNLFVTGYVSKELCNRLAQASHFQTIAKGSGFKVLPSCDYRLYNFSYDWFMSYQLVQEDWPLGSFWGNAIFIDWLWNYHFREERLQWDICPIVVVKIKDYNVTGQTLKALEKIYTFLRWRDFPVRKDIAGKDPCWKLWSGTDDLDKRYGESVEFINMTNLNQQRLDEAFREIDLRIANVPLMGPFVVLIGPHQLLPLRYKGLTFTV